MTDMLQYPGINNHENDLSELLFTPAVLQKKMSNLARVGQREKSNLGRFIVP